MSARRLAAPLALFAVLASARAASAFCPCYTASSSANDKGCAIEAAPGTNPTVDEWNAIFDLVSRGPAAWGDKGPSVGDIGQGCGKPEPTMNVPARFPCELLKAIAMVETGWRQFCVPDLPSDQKGGAERTIISFDCGYGVGQVTSGMHVGETPDFDRNRVASDATYNLATGTRILAGKWKATNCVGDNQPKVIEHWYTATWAYNGLAYVNNPSNPNYDANRGVWNPKVGGAAPYQEKVFGYIENTLGKWEPTALAYPNPGEVGSTGSPPDLPEPSCASPTDCVNERSTHLTSCDGTTGTGGAGGAGTGGAGGGNAGGAGGAGAGGAGVGGAGVGGGGNTGGEAGAGGAGNDGDPTWRGQCSCRAAGAPEGGRAPLGAIAALGLGWAALAGRRGRRGGKG